MSAKGKSIHTRPFQIDVFPAFSSSQLAAVRGLGSDNLHAVFLNYYSYYSLMDLSYRNVSNSLLILVKLSIATTLYDNKCHNLILCSGVCVGGGEREGPKHTTCVSFKLVS